MKFDFTSESYERKFSSNLFVCNLIIGCSEKEYGNFVPRKAFEQGKKEIWTKS